MRSGPSIECIVCTASLVAYEKLFGKFKHIAEQQELVCVVNFKIQLFTKVMG